MRLDSKQMRARAARVLVARQRTDYVRAHGGGAITRRPVTSRQPFARSREMHCDTGTKGQMTIEFAVMFPVMLMIALVAFNSIMFLAQCSSFDRIFRESVCVYAPSPASEQAAGQICAQIAAELEPYQEKDYLECTVDSGAQDSGLTTYRGTLAYTPTVFGAYPLRQVFGVALPPIEHIVEMTVDSYKPGVFL